MAPAAADLNNPHAWERYMSSLGAEKAELELLLVRQKQAARPRQPCGDDIQDTRDRLTDIPGSMAMAQHALGLLQAGYRITAVEPGSPWILSVARDDDGPGWRGLAGRGDRLLSQGEVEAMFADRARERQREWRRVEHETLRIRCGNSVAMLWQRIERHALMIHEHQCETCGGRIATGALMVQLARGRVFSGFETPTYLESRETDREWHAECHTLDTSAHRSGCVACGKPVDDATVYYATVGLCPGPAYRRPELRPGIVYMAHDDGCHQDAWARLMHRMESRAAAR